MTEPEDAAPYPGGTYGEADAARFHGRSGEVHEIASLLAVSRLLVVHGPAAVGKSSLVRAGVLPRLTAGRARLLPVAAGTADDVAPSASTGRNPLTASIVGAWGRSGFGGALSARQFLAVLPRAVDEQGDIPTVAVVDGLERALVRAAPVHVDALLADLFQAVADLSWLRLVLVVRDDVVDDLLPYEERLPNRFRARVRVRPLGPDAALAAVTQPLEATARRFAPGVAEDLVARLRTTTVVDASGERTVVAGTVEPAYLQLVCSTLWRDLPPAVSAITSDVLDAAGDPAQVVSRRCAEVVAEVAEDERQEVTAVWAWLRRLVTDRGTRDAVHEGLDTTGGMPTSVARALEQRGVLRSARRAGATWYELLHDGYVQAVRRGPPEAGDEGPAPDEPSTGAYLTMGRAALANGLSAAAVEYVARAVRAGEGDRRVEAEAELLLAEVAVQQAQREGEEPADDRWAAAEAHHRRAAELFATADDAAAVGRALSSLGRMFLVRRRYADALAALQGAVQRLPGAPSPKMDLARALLGAGQPQAAAAEYGSVLVVAPDDVDALVARGVIGAEHGHAATALADLDDAIRLRPDVAGRRDVIAARSAAHERLGR